MDHKCPTCGATHRSENGLALDLFFFVFFSTMAALLAAAFVPTNLPAIGLAWMVGLLVGAWYAVKNEKNNAEAIERIKRNMQE